MKYYLAIDKGEKTNYTNRYFILNLDNIEPKLNKNNNLKLLTNYTMAFTNSQALKNFLNNNKALPSKYLAYDLVIVYKIKYKQREYTRKLAVPYYSSRPYFSLENLINIIFKNAQNTEYLLIFLREISKKYLHSESFYHIIEDMSNFCLQEKLYNHIYSLVYEICYPKEKGKRTFRYRRLYDLAFITAKLDNMKYHANELPKKTIITKKLSEVELLELESLIDRVKDPELKQTLTIKLNEQYHIHQKELKQIFLT